jgi:hypothetical protein
MWLPVLMEYFMIALIPASIIAIFWLIRRSGRE